MAARASGLLFKAEEMEALRQPNTSVDCCIWQSLVGARYPCRRTRRLKNVKLLLFALCGACPEFMDFSPHPLNGVAILDKRRWKSPKKY